MKKNIAFILLLLTISCNFTGQKEKKLDKFLLSDSCDNFFAYDAISCLKKQIAENKNSDSITLPYYIKLASFYFKVNEKEKFKSTLDTINKLISQLSPSDKIRVEYLTIKGLDKLDETKYNEALPLFKEAASLLKKSDTSLLFINYKIAVCYERMSDYDSSEFYYKRALFFKNKLRNIFTDNVSMLYNALAYNYFARYSDLYTAKLYFDSVEYITKRIKNPDSSNYAWNLFNMALFYQNIGNLPKVENCHSEAIKIYSKYNTFSDKVAMIKINQSYNYISLEKFELAHTKTDWLIYYYTKNFSPLILGKLYSQKGYIFFRERKNRDAIQYFKKALSLNYKYSQNLELGLLNSIAWCYSNDNKLDSAEYFFKQCMKIDPINEMGEITSLYGEYARLQIKKKKYQNAINIIDSKLPLVTRKIGKKSIQYGYYIFWKALAYEKLENYDLAIKLYQEVIEISINKTIQDKYSLPNFDISEIIEHDNLIDALIGKASVLSKMAFSSQNKDMKIHFFKKSLEHYEKAFEVVSNVNKRMESENDRLLFTGKKSVITDKILLNAYELYTLTHEQEFIEKAFNIGDMGKATQVVLGLKDDEYKHLSGIPEEMIQKEKNMQEEISLLQNSLREEKQLHNSDTIRITYLNNKLYNTLNAYEKLRLKMNSDFPNYNQLKYSDNKVNVDTLKKILSQNKVLISFTYSGDSLFSFLLSNKKLEMNVTYVKNLNDSILNFRRLITEINDTSFMYQGILDYVPRAYYLYKVLIKPFESDIKDKNLILIPDGLLNLLPFEALVTSDSLPLKTDYALLPYLLYKHTISYSYSAELLILRNKMKTIPSNNVLAYAPEYNNTVIKRPVSKDGDSENIILGQLRGSQEEVSNISVEFGGSAITGKKATKSIFKKKASSNSIIHLSMHTIIDNEYPMYSKLVFTPGKDTSDNEFLNTYEVYNLKLHAPLIVLSACNTGYGKIMKGEGIISLARGFIYSGCPSLVITLWSIADRSSSNLMQGFYKNLKLNNDIDEALKQAKVEYIYNSDQRLSHPYFWAGYIQTGKTVPVYKRGINYTGLSLACGLLILTLSLILLIQKRKRITNFQ